MAKPKAIALLLLVASFGLAFGAQGRRLHQATAIATADARSTGSPVIVNSNANAVSTGTPTTAVATGSGTSSPGQTVVVNCNAFAKDSVQFKNCVNNPGVTFENAPACNANTPGATCSVRDTLGRCWNFENGRSCVYKDTADRPLTASQISAQATASATVAGRSGTYGTPAITPPTYGGAVPIPSPAAGKTVGRRRH